MSPLYTFNGLLLRIENALAAGPDCCCDKDKEKEKGCGDCTKNCCLIVQGRNMCEGGVIFGDDDITVEGWGSIGIDIFLWSKQTAQISQYIYIVLGDCLPNGTFSFGLIASGSSANNEPLQSKEYQWNNAFATLDNDGCTNEVNLGGKITVCGDFGCGSTNPIDPPDISFICT